MNPEELIEHAKKITVFHDYINNLKDKGLKSGVEDKNYDLEYIIKEIEDLQKVLYYNLGKAIINDK